ncbi:bifunctional DNA primase/polymerase [Phaeobacter gallaeciensis]|uniref:bifunctional DNA primase/polymerase n=1 Tax=Phaeobacter gallaeciensis TaxID=60890 RepID=UPI00237F094D|nr:bifunctional DNA primase/polymerase [Phaeobacter gallaeciensis]MDE4063829.1 bifunctional DNA primase/polymerase [Phaeobacter gallaeciensis]MDE4126858.1 bifunctional DNA primase/polymerase [Phaeobacter gallaeciensis]MDE4131324.1 bifunctional DNA primase/polymerase [Phaeobacter gallaeciensis]
MADNPFALAGQNIPDDADCDLIVQDEAQTSNVIKLEPRHDAPHDRLPTEGFFKLPPRKSLYHTERAQAARQRAQADLPEELVDAMQTLVDAGLRRVNPAYEDVADHNAMTLACALKYAACGLHVIDSHAIDPKTGEGTDPQGLAKLPRGSKWQDRASCDPAEIVSFWTGDGEYPPTKKGETYPYARVSAPRNVSIAFPPDCGLFVLDIDGDAGMAALAELEDEHGELPRTAKSVTGSGGWHFIFRTPRPIRNTASQIAPGVDIRGEGGQIIAAPSIHKSGNFYQWAEGCAPWDGITDAPEWLVELAVNASKITGNGKGRKTAKKAGRRSAAAKARDSEARGFQTILVTIGDHDGGAGFDSPVNRAACSWFSTNGTDADSSALFDALRARIDEAERDPDRDRSKYDTDEYLSERIEKAREHIAEERAKPETLIEKASQFTEDSEDDEIRDLLKGAHEARVSVSTRNRIIAKIADVSSWGKRDVNRFWKELDVDQRREERAERGPGVDLSSGGFRDHCDESATLMAEQGDEPTMFHSNGRIAEIRTDEQGALKIENVDKDRYKARMEDKIDFWGKEGTVEAPSGVVNNVFHRDKTAYPPLHKIIRAPAFDPDKQLITEPGYHSSGVIYKPQDGVVVPLVSAHPTRAEVRAAVDNLVDVLGDFMLDALPREELASAVREGRHVPSFCHALSFGLTALCRAFIDGPTPGHFVRKMKPRTGATKLLSSVSYMATLSYAKPQSLPDSKQEIQKTVTASLDSGQQFTFFDNLPDSGKVESGELAAVMTAWPFYTGRRLGVTAMVDAKVENTFGFTGNKTVLSPELAARMQLIVLDPQMENPEDRTGFKYDLASHVPANAGKYLHSFLTIVQYWIAEGCREWTGKPLGGFERHSAIIGGILEAAGIRGFLDNRDVLRSTANTASPEDDLMDALIELHHGKENTLFRVWSADAPPQWIGTGADREKHPLAGHRVVSIKETLEAESIALKGTGYAQMEDGGVIYPDRAKPALRQFIGAMVDSVREWGPDREEEEKKQGRYIFEKVHTDRHSILYQLKRLELVS